jgi:recombinational DNA repair protein (RecF pathway)
MQLDGLVIQVIPQKERDAIIRLILRQGTCLSVYAYGGMGGGKNAKPRSFEPGNLLRIELSTTGKGRLSDDALKVIQDYSILWQPRFFRHNPQAFAQACLMMEMSLNTALPFTSENFEQTSHLFNVLSNGLFHLDASLELEKFHGPTQLFLFLSKFLLSLGIFPDESECVFCGAAIDDDSQSPLIIDQGGFSCWKCRDQIQEKVILSPIRTNLSQAVRMKYDQWEKMPRATSAMVNQLIQFWGHHFHFNPQNLASLSLLNSFK